jgi:hypothetical protein
VWWANAIKKLEAGSFLYWPRFETQKSTKSGFTERTEPYIHIGAFSI